MTAPTLRPSVLDVEAIGADARPIPRNLRITQAYHQLSVAAAAALGPGGGANWCTFATWASKQAGQSIRGDDLGGKIEDAFVASDVVPDVVTRLRDMRRAVGRTIDTEQVLVALRNACAPLLTVTRVADAVARGNKKVFDEIGTEFARAVTVLGPGSDGAAFERFLGGLRQGDPPDGQGLLAAAFRDYHRAANLTDVKARAERMLLGNARIGLHEQTRLQPEIADALNAPVPDPATIARRLLDEVLADRRAHLPRLREVLGEVAGRVLEPLRAVVRRIVTEELMTFALPDGRVLRLGADLTGGFPPSLAKLEDPELVAFMRTVDPTPNSLAGSGAADWADLADRMHMILDLFRQQHENPDLFRPPYTEEQVRLIAAGLTPDGRL